MTADRVPGVARIDGPAVPDLNAFWRNVDQCGAPRDLNQRCGDLINR